MSITNELVEARRREVQSVELTYEELFSAILEGINVAKQRKWQKERRGDNDSMRAGEPDSKNSLKIK